MRPGSLWQGYSQSLQHSASADGKMLTGVRGCFANDAEGMTEHPSWALNMCWCLCLKQWLHVVSNVNIISPKVRMCPCSAGSPRLLPYPWDTWTPGWAECELLKAEEPTTRAVEEAGASVRGKRHLSYRQVGGAVAAGATLTGQEPLSPNLWGHQVKG